MFQENKETMKDKQRAQKLEKPYQVSYIYLLIHLNVYRKKKLAEVLISVLQISPISLDISEFF